LRLVDLLVTRQSFILLRSIVDHCHVQSTSLEESWPAWFALN